MTLLLVGGVALILILAAWLTGYAIGNRDGWNDCTLANQSRDSELAATHRRRA